MQACDESMEEVLARVDIDAADDSLGELAEVGGEMEEKVGDRRRGGARRAGSVRSRSGEGRVVCEEGRRPASPEPKHLSMSLRRARRPQTRRVSDRCSTLRAAVLARRRALLSITTGMAPRVVVVFPPKSDSPFTYGRSCGASERSSRRQANAVGVRKPTASVEVPGHAPRHRADQRRGRRRRRAVGVRTTRHVRLHARIRLLRLGRFPSHAVLPQFLIDVDRSQVRGGHTM